MRDGDQLVIDRDFVAEFARNAHVIGAEQKMKSATLGYKIIESDVFFDLYAIDSYESNREKRLIFKQYFYEMAKRLGDRMNNIKNEEFRRVLIDPYSTPKQLMEATAKVDDGYFERLFNMDAGNSEGYTLGEHTETVLDNLENNFADKLPVGVLSAMRLILITHDIGKSIAVKEGHKHEQDKYNDFFAKEFLNSIGGLDPNTINFIINMRKGMDLASRAILDRYKYTNPISEDEIRDFMADRLREIDVQPNDRFEQGCAYLVKALLICDGGAYTSKARTRRKKGDGEIMFSNYPAFDSTFRDNPNDLTGRRLVMKR